MGRQICTQLLLMGSDRGVSDLQEPQERGAFLWGVGLVGVGSLSWALQDE